MPDLIFVLTERQFSKLPDATKSAVNTRWAKVVKQYKKIVDECNALRAENEKLRDVNNKTYCAYCSAEYARTDDALAQVREHIAVCEFHPMRELENKVKNALSEAVNVIYLDDNSDYLPALWTIVRTLGGQEAADLLENDEQEATRRYCRE